MPDLRDSFDALRRDLDATQAPDMLADAFRRAPSMGGPDGPSPWRRAGIIALALVIAVASTLFVVRAFDRDQAGPAAKAGVLPYPLAYTGADVPDPHWAHGQLWLMDQAGQRITLASIPGEETAVPAWSPDGSQIAFAAELDDLGTQIWLVNADGTDLHELTKMVPMDGSAINDAPAWSPDGTRIAFNCYNSQGHQVCVVNADGSGNPRMLTGHINVAHDTPPVWLGPNELMFSTDGPPAEGTFTVSLDGGELTRIGTARRLMTISPDRQSIAFLCPSYQAICTESVDLSDRHQVSFPGAEFDEQPAWLPDGRLSFLRSDEAGTFDGFQLYVVDAQGGEPTELADLGSDVRGLGWGPSEDQSEPLSPAPQATDSSPGPTDPSPSAEATGSDTGQPTATSSPSGGTYQLSNFDVTFPAPTATGSNDPSAAEVDFDSKWSTDFYPGRATCTIKLLDSAGSAIASQEMSFAHMEPTAHFSAAVPVAQGTPRSATGDCGPGMVFVGSSYVFDNLRVVGDTVVGDVTWSAGTPVGDAACAARIVAPDGQADIHVGTLGVGEGNDQDVMTLDKTYGPDAAVSFRCEPYRSPEQLDNAYWLPWHA